MSLIRNAASILTTQAVMVPLNIVASIVLARYLSLEDRGSFAIAVSIGAVTVVISMVGWPAASIFRLRRSRSDPALVATTGVMAVAAFSGLAIALCLVMRQQLADWFLRGTPLLVLYLALAMVPFQLLGNVFSGIARGLDRFAMQNRYRLAVSAGRLGAFSLVLVLAGGKLVEALVALLAVYAIASVGLTLSVTRLTGIRARPDRADFLGTLRFGSKAWAQALAGNVHERADLFMLAYLLQDSSEVALYAIAVGVSTYLYHFPEAIAVSALPQITALERGDAGRLAAATLRNTIVWVLLSVLVAAPIAPYLLPWVYGSAYAGSVAPFLVLLLAVPLRTLFLILARYFFAIDRQGVNISLVLVSMPLNIVLNLWLIPRYGILGAALASLISYSLEGIAIAAIFLGTAETGFREALLLRREDLAFYSERLRRTLRRLQHPR
jgi:O-antigen/teichoic acid export membrane protein